MSSGHCTRNSTCRIGLSFKSTAPHTDLKGVPGVTSPRDTTAPETLSFKTGSFAFSPSQSFAILFENRSRFPTPLATAATSHAALDLDRHRFSFELGFPSASHRISRCHRCEAEGGLATPSPSSLCGFGEIRIQELILEEVGGSTTHRLGEDRIAEHHNPTALDLDDFHDSHSPVCCWSAPHTLLDGVHLFVIDSAQSPSHLS